MTADMTVSLSNRSSRNEEVRDDQACAGLSVIKAIAERRSIRRFLSTPVPEETLRAILSCASRAPSGTNFQPWHVHVVTGAALANLSRAVIAAAEAGERYEEYAYAPNPVMEPYLSRRRKVGFDLYALYGVERGDLAGRKAAMLRNFEFFGAPVGLFFSMERCLTEGSWLDCGMFMQNVMLIARTFGLETCAQQAWCEFGQIVHEELDIPASHIILSGMAIGFPDMTARENTLKSDREPVDAFARFHK